MIHSHMSSTLCACMVSCDLNKEQTGRVLALTIQFISNTSIYKIDCLVFFCECFTKASNQLFFFFFFYNHSVFKEI